MHFVAARSIASMACAACVVFLFEGVVTGAADGYGAAMTGRALPQRRCCIAGPGLANNGLANLHNARRAFRRRSSTSSSNQATHHRPLDAKAADRGHRGAGRAAPRAGCMRDHLGNGRCRCGGGGCRRHAVLSRPDRHADPAVRYFLARTRRRIVADALPVPAAPRADSAQATNAARLLRRGEPTVLMLGGNAVSRPEGTRARPSRRPPPPARGSGAGIERAAGARAGQGAGVDRVPYVVDDDDQRALAGTRQMILVGARKPVTFFAYPNKPGTSVPPDADVHILARPDQDAAEALARLVEELGAPRAPLPDPGPHAVAVVARSPRQSSLPLSRRCCRKAR